MAPQDGLSVSRGWQEQIQCRCGVGLSSTRDVSSPCQVNDRMLGQLGNVGRALCAVLVAVCKCPFIIIIIIIIILLLLLLLLNTMEYTGWSKKTVPQF